MNNSVAPVTQVPFDRFDEARDFVLVLTASVNVNNNPNTICSNPMKREADYIQSLCYYLAEHPAIRRIVLIENSAWPLDRIRAAADSIPHGKELELISLDTNNYPRHLGKGYGEFMLLDLGFDQSKLLQKASHFGKVTGRLHLKNISQLLKRMKRSFDLLCDMHDHDFWPKLGVAWKANECDTRFLAFSKTYYRQRIYGNYALMDDSRKIYAEHVMYRIVKTPDPNFVVVPRFPIEPRWVGVSGAGIHYHSWRAKVKYYPRSVVRCLCPQFHF